VTMADIGAESAADRNEHSVTLGQITDMYERWED